MPISKLFVNRELSWIRFNTRVLMEASRASNPPLERAKFLSIVSSNLDEFFMVRVGKLERKADAGLDIVDPAGMTPVQQLRAIRRAVPKQVDKQYALYNDDVLPLLKDHGLHLLSMQELTEGQRNWLSSYFDAQVMPVLTPRTINPSHPFPLLAAKRIYIAVLLQSDKGGAPQLSLVPVPAQLKRIILLPMGEGRARGVFLEDLIIAHLSRLFPYMDPICWMPFRITRNTDFVIDIENADNLIDEMRKSIKRRSYGKIVRVEVPRRRNALIYSRVMKALEAPRRIVIEVDGPLDLRFLMREIAGYEGFDDLKYVPFTPAMSPRLAVRESIFRSIRGGDLFFHHPYDSFDPVLRFVREAAEDAQVLAIKQTLYRVSSKSILVPSLARAAQLGKQVTVLVEVRARFDEENNINWCKTLEAAGCHVLYGVPRWKTHSKITLVVRREPEGLRQYVHIGTGNYNDSTAKQYTDMGILTCDRQIGEDASAFFNIITGYSYTFPMENLIASPYALRSAFTNRLARLAELARAGQQTAFFAKMNSLSDPGIIQAIYDACNAGVEVRLIVRGICCLRLARHPHLEVRSIVGRFLEHARVYIFQAGEECEVFISSADMMVRNLDKRVELTSPIKDPAIAAQIVEALDRQWEDNTQAWRLCANDEYERVRNNLPPYNVQEDFINRARAQQQAAQG
ncbi:MAG: polyphosphate kinase 1 [Clostridiales bacterium]|nr:polyphosphate kinase 1 [Clostridiales bacterium]